MLREPYRLIKRHTLRFAIFVVRTIILGKSLASGHVRGGEPETKRARKEEDFWIILDL